MIKFSGIKNKFSSLIKSSSEVELGEDYVELEADVKGSKAKINIRPFTLETFEDVKSILTAIREGYTIALINIAPIKEKDRTGLKRAVDKLKKTLEANDGDIAGFGENWLIATPSFAKVYRGGEEESEEPEVKVINE